MNELIQRGITALKAGDRISARQWLGSAVRQDSANLLAWLWLSAAVDTDEERLDCLRQVLRLDPDNQSASQGLAEILEHSPHLRPQIIEMLAPHSPPPAEEDAPPTDESQEDSEEALLDRVMQQMTALDPPQDQPTPDGTREKANLSAVSRQPAQINELLGQRIIHPIYPRPIKSPTDSQRSVFRARPSLVPVIFFFWVMVLAIYGMMMPFKMQIELVFPAILILAAACVLIVLYLLIRLLLTRYELTTHSLNLPYRGATIHVPISKIFSVAAQQTGLQKMIGTGDIVCDAAVNNILTSLRIHNIPQVQQRAEQILHLMRDQR